MCLEAVSAIENMVATNPGALKNGRRSLLPGRRRVIFRNIVCDLSNIREPFDIAGRDGLLGDLVGGSILRRSRASNKPPG